MTDEQRIARLQSVRDNLNRVMIGAIATVNQDGTPHNSPVFVAFDEAFSIIWSSLPEAQHSRNIAQASHQAPVFITLFDSVQAHGGGLYIAAQARMLEATDPEFESVYQAFATRKQQFGGVAATKAAYQAPDGQRLYIATPSQIWVNFSHKNEQGAVLSDTRCELTSQEIKALTLKETHNENTAQ